MVSMPMGVMVRPGVTQLTRMRGARARAALLDAGLGRDARDQHDRAAILEQGSASLQNVECTVQVGIHHPLPLFRSDLGKGGVQT